MKVPNAKNICRISFLVITITLTIYLVFSLRGLLLPFFLAFFLTYLLNPLVNAVENKGTPRILAILMIYLGLFFVIASIVIFGLPKMLNQLNKFAEAIPVYIKEVQNILASFQDNYSRFSMPESIRDVLDDRIKQMENISLGIVKSIVDAILGLFSYLFYFILAPILSFYFLKDINYINKLFTNILPQKYRSDILGLVRDVDDILSNFIRGHFLVCILIGLLTWLAMSILGLEFAILIGIIAGITELIPYFGPILGAIPAVGLAFLQSKALVWKVILAIFIIQQLESNIISPKILGDRLGLHPALIIFVILAAGQLFGVWGMLISVPVAAIIKVVLNYIYLKLVS